MDSTFWGHSGTAVSWCWPLGGSAETISLVGLYSGLHICAAHNQLLDKLIRRHGDPHAYTPIVPRVSSGLLGADL